MKSCSRKILDLFYNAKHAGRIVKPDAIGRVGGQDDGLVIELSWRIANDTIIDAKFRAFGNPNAIAITSLMTDYFIGKTLEEVMNIDESVIVEALDELKPEYLEVYEIVCSAMAEAYEYYLKRKDKRAHEFVASEAGEVDLDATSNVEVEQELTQEEVERRIQLSIQRELTDDTRRTKEGVQVIGESRGRGRPKKERTPEELAALALAQSSSRGRGRPRKERTEEELAQMQQKSTRGRGRPKKERTPEELEALALARSSSRGRGRPRKERTAEELQALALAQSEKRGRGRPRKERTEEELAQMQEKASRGRGRPRKERIEIEVIGEKRGRGRPRKSEPVKINFPKSDLDEVITDEVVEQLISGSSDKEKDNASEPISINFLQQVENNDTSNIEDVINYQLLNNAEKEDEQQELFEGISYLRDEEDGYSVDNVEQLNDSNDDFVEKRGRGRPRKERIEIEVIGEKRGRGRPRKEVEELEVGEKRGRGRPRKERTEEELEALASTEKRGRGRPRKEIDPNIQAVEEEKRGRGRPRKEVDNDQALEDMEEKRGRGRPRKDETISMVSPTNSLTRSLTGGGIPYHKTQDIVFASKNVTTTNININVTKTTNSNGEYNNEYSKNINVTSVSEDSVISNSAPLNFNNQVTESDNEVEVENIGEELPANETVIDEIDVNSQNVDNQSNEEVKDLYSNTSYENDDIDGKDEFEDLDEEYEDDVHEDDYDDQDDYTQEGHDEDEDNDEDIDASHIKDEAPKGGIEDLLRALLDD